MTARISRKQAEALFRDPLRSSVPAPVGRVNAGVPGHINLPIPPSVNACFRDPSAKERARGVKGRIRSKVYNEWREEALRWVLAQKGRAVGLPATVTVHVGPCSQARDLDNLAKPLLDILVRSGILHNDNLKNVHEVRLVKDFEGVAPGIVRLVVSPVNDVRTA